MDKFLRERGIVSVFLAIILIPSIIVSSMFVDLSRVLLSKGPATSAADLALNSLLSNYDAELAELYGLFGSCQDIDSYYEEAEKYFVKSLKSQSLSDDEIDNLLALFMSAISGGDGTSDLLAIQAVPAEEGKSMVGPVKNTGLNNPTIIEDQVVEFMKYRGPVEIVTGIIQRLKDSGAEENFGKGKENEDLVEAKDDFCEDADDLSRQLYYANERIKDYKKVYLSKDELKTISKDLTNYRELYREINLKMVSNLHGTSGLTVFSRYTMSITYYVDKFKLGSTEFKKESNKLYSSKVENGDGTTTYYINEEYMTALIETLETEKQDFVNAKNEVINKATKSLIDADVGTGNNQNNPVQWWKKVNSNISSYYENSYKPSVWNMLRAYAKLLAAGECEIDETYAKTWKKTDKDRYEKIIDDVKSLQGKYLVVGKTDATDYYLKLVNKLESVSRQQINNINSGSLKLTNGKTIGTTVSDISTSLTTHKKDLKAMIEAIDVILNGDGGDKLDLPTDKYKGLDALESYVDDYNKSFKKWEAEAKEDEGDKAMADADLDEIDKNRDQYSKVNKESITELETRFKNIRSLAQGLLDAIDKMTYGGKKIVEIKDYNTVYSKAKDKIGTVPMKNSAIKTHAESVFKQLFVTYTADVKTEVHKLSNINKHTYDPKIDAPTLPILYDYIVTQFRDADEVSKKDREDKMDEIDDQDGKNDDTEANEKKAKKGKTDGVSKKNIYKGGYTASEFPSKLAYSKNKEVGVTDFFKSIGGIISGIVSGDKVATNLRDNLYLTEYCMSMFSFATYENEGKRALYEAKDGAETLTLSNYEKHYESVTGDINTENTWLWQDVTARYNQSLTNRKINPINNVACGAEVEYILYGNTNVKCVQSAYTDIFTIRYALNLVSGFMYFWPPSKNDTARTINLTANALSGLTSGVVPAIFIKTVLIALLTAAETIRDLDVLEAGLKVPIFKTVPDFGEVDEKSDWYYSIKLNEMTSAKGDDSAGADKPGLYYSDYMYLFLMMGFGNTEKKPIMLKRMADLIQANMRRANGEGDYCLAKAITYFKIEGTVKVKPLMLDLTFVDQFTTNNPKNNANVFTYKIKEIRGYS